MSNPINIEVSISKPVTLELEVDPGYVVTPGYQIAPEPLFTGSEAFKLVPGDKAKIDASVTLLFGDKYSSVHAGELGQFSLADDYLYVCVKAGTAGNAIWKKTVLFYST
ncbi:MAG TPA: hypothetical protein VLH16_02105 [Bacteroidales bacterium]|nr:hypothetical protein [Bacteroidales bacterium]